MEYGQEIFLLESIGEGCQVIKRVLIANRGEIALRILRACRQLGLEAVVAYSEADARLARGARLPTRRSASAQPTRSSSYLSAPAIISAALATGCDAIHPGYGFLSENAAFAEAVAAHKLTFIGPSAPILEKFHSKAATRALLAKHGLPTIPGSDGVVADEAAALDAAKKIGYPVILKASAGGGGRGMRVAQDAAELSKNFSICAQEAQAAFGDGSHLFGEVSQRTRTMLRCRSPSIVKGRRSTLASATARCSDATRSSLKSRHPRRSRRACAKSSLRAPQRRSAPPAIATWGRWNSWLAQTGSRTSLRSTAASRWSIRSPRW